MAKRTKKTAKKRARATKQSNASSQNKRFIGERELLQLAEKSDTTKTKTATIGKNYRDDIAYAVEHQGLNRTAWGMADKLRRMFNKDKPDAQMTLDHLLYYINTLNLRAKGTKPLNLEVPKPAPTSGPGTPTPESDLAKIGRGEPEADNVTPLRERAVA